ncbi:MAG: PAS domain-containing protein [Pseudomonadota bacterium]
MIGAVYQSSRHIVHKAQVNLTVEYSRQMDMLESVVLTVLSVDGKAGSNFDLQRISSAISERKYGPDVTLVTFRDTADVTAFSHEIAVALEAPLFFARWCGLEQTKIIRPVIVDGVYYGLLSLSMSPNRIINEAWDNYRYLVKVLAFSFVILLFGIGFVLHKALGPLRTLVDASKKLADGDFLVRVKTDGSPELQSVLLSFNQMASSLQETLSALQESEERFRVIFERSIDGKSLTAPDGKFLQVNKSFAEMLGYPINEIQQINSAQVTHPDDLAESRECVRMLLAGEKTFYRMEERYVQKNGNTVWADVSTLLIRDEQGTPLYFITSIIDITERKRIEEALRSSEQRLKLAQQSAGAGGWDWNIATGRLDWSPELFILFGLEPDKAEAKFDIWNQVLHPDDKDEANRRIERSIKQGTSLDSEYRIIHPGPGGHVRWIKALGSALYDQARKPIRMSGICIDITERKLAEEALKETERVKSGLLEKLNAAQQIARIGSWEWNLQTNRVWWSDETYRIFGVNPKDFIPGFEANGKLIHPDDFERYAKAFDHSFQTGEPLDLDIRLIAADGQLKQCNAKGKIDYDDSGQPVRFIGTIMDVTDRVQSGKERFRLQTQLSNALEIAHLGHWEYDVAKDLFTFNDHFYKIFHTTAEEVGGYTMPSAEYARRFVHPDDMAAVGEETQKAIETRDPNFTRHIEHRMLYADGTQGYITVRFFIVKDEQGRTVKTYGVNQDITERKQAEAEKETLQAQLSQAQKMESVGRLAGGVAHDFNNMLNVIIGNTELALEQVDPGGQLFVDLTEIQNAAKRSADLTRQLLAFARKQTVSPRVLDLNQTVESMLTMLQRLIGEDIDLTWVPGADVWPVVMDPSQIDQILANLSVNARDAIAGTGEIFIRTENTTLDENYCKEHVGFTPGDYSVLSVSDTGCGMDARTLAQLFEPFFTTKELGKGTGLGLATVYGIVKQNKGFINVYSEPGQGTTFTIYLLRHLAGAADIPKELSMEPLSRGQETILVVEDEPSILKLATRILKTQGYTVLSANSPGQAIQMAREHAGEIHLLMTDVVMPEMNGRDLAKKLLSLYPDLKRLFMSGYTADVIAHQGVLDHDLYFLQKPFSRQGLGDKVREVLDETNGTPHA